MVDLHFLIDALGAPGGVPRQRRLYDSLKAGILDGHLQAGAVLPSTRALAQDLVMARNGVIHAYERLAAEGYVKPSRQGTVVAALAPAAGRASRPPPLPVPSLSSRVQGCRRVRSPQDELRPFMPGTPALAEFPLRLWQRLCERAARQGGWDDLGYRHAMGEPELRQAIATHLRAARGVRCRADQVIVTDGTQHSLELCAQILADVGNRAWIEHPGYGGAWTALRQAGLAVLPVTVDAEGIAPTDALWRQHPPRVVYTTPSHQYPLGSVLSLPRRLALIEQARRHGAWILEDDYDSEFRHDGPPLSAMQGLVDDAPVVYLGTFSKSMFPGLRLGFIVLPEAVASRAVEVVGELARRGHAFEQRALAAFIGEGHFASHLRRMRKLYAARQQALRQALERHWPWPMSVLGGQGGMHIVLSLPADCPDTLAAQAAFDAGLSPRPLSMYGTGGISGFNGLVMGYAHVPADRVDAHVRTLARAVVHCRRPGPLGR